MRLIERRIEEIEKERKRWWGCIEITLRGVPRERVVRKPTRKYVPSRNRESKIEKENEKNIWRWRRKGEIRERERKIEEKRPCNCTSAVDRKSKLETRGRRSGGKKRVRNEYVIHVFAHADLHCRIQVMYFDRWTKRRKKEKSYFPRELSVISVLLEIVLLNMFAWLVNSIKRLKCERKELQLVVKNKMEIKLESSDNDFTATRN